MRIFFDTSAFAKRFIEEKGSEQVIELCDKASELGLSIICLPELISATCRLKREKKISMAHFRLIKKALLKEIEEISICQLTETVIAKSIQALENNGLRAMDAIHIACALTWQAELFVSADKPQIQAAKNLGLKTVLV
ncbi:MAG: type II toxin-antitoxin system VapC family toxin [Gammaproteobacteria bacterium]|nr:type II toxin-antitoxin system VapC family toxin [Gammaproteobacteria bacterium]